ncbi:MAG TPA: HAD-IA family hydrolase [Gaiellaceae bacterium]|nr:HAD-IA family hydrolase [Gaiellaceae bacterium]
MLEAVLFDWNNTLVRLEWDDGLVAAGHRAALGRDDPAFTARWRRLVLSGEHGYRPYAELLAELGVDEPDRFIDREHEVWRPWYTTLPSGRALLESLRASGLTTGLVANSWPDPGRILRGDAEALGFAPLLDTMVFSADVAARKPAPAIFLRACEALGVAPEATLHVGDDLVADVQGAAGVGMTTVQALWFRSDDREGIVPDFTASVPADVLEIARRLA